MTLFIVRRLLHTVLVAFAALVVIFVLVRLSGDPAQMMAGVDASPEEVAELRERLGLNEPVPIQLRNFIGNALRGDFGQSLRYSSSAVAVVMERLPATVELTLTALLITIVVAVPVGVISATRRGSLMDRLVMITTLMGQTVPVFWLGLILILIFAVRLAWFPTGGRAGVVSLILPAITLAAFNVARVARLVRSEMLDVMSEDFIRVARSKGLGEQAILIGHALKNAAIPIVTIVGLQVGHLLGGAVVTETVFSWPGVGRLLVQSIQFRDFTVLQVAVFMLAITVALINLLVDLSYAWLDPRVRYQ
jgi:peptide/nickel transport system permease protein